MSAVSRTLMVSVFALMSFTAHAQCQQTIIVRHAEKADDGTRDPPLSFAGQIRATRLADILKDADIVGLYASQYQRTQQTLAPLAQAHNLSVRIHPIGEGGSSVQAADIAREVRLTARTGTVVVAGHSNTVDDLVAAFGETVIDELEHNDYDTFFVIDRCGEAPAQLHKQDFSRASLHEK